ncbi:MAG: SMP-30/gluconolactonase/LRE family protein [Planctomycetes bacterium]|nr:SMP-30/gluconolactonase/LRE family protein [Planctomycetota bacterium]
MKLSNFSLSYKAPFARGELDAFRFLALSRELGVEGASFHVGDLGSLEPAHLRRVRRAYLDHGLSVSLLAVSTDLARPEEELAGEMAKAREAVRAAVILGAPVLRIFAGSPPDEAGRAAAFESAVRAARALCEEAAEAGVPVGLQNHNHGALVRTGAEALRFIQAVGHPNLTFVLDTGQFAGCRGASGPAPPELRGADFMESIRETAPIARFVRAKFYEPRADGSEPAIDYDRVLDILRGVHYQGFVDLVYEPNRSDGGPGEDPRTAIPRFLAFLRSRLRALEAAPRPALAAPAPAASAARYAGVSNAAYFEDGEPRTEAQVAFLEGPVADLEGRVCFSNIDREQILRWDPASKKVEVLRERSNGANGLRFDREGRLIACEGGGRVTRTDLRTGAVEVLAESWEGKPLGSPNDLELDGRGRIYFTSRTSNRDPSKGSVSGVYRIDAPGRVARILAWPQVHMPNGLATSPDDRTLYLIDADGGEGGARRVRAYDLAPDGTVSKERTVHDFYPGRSGDGMAVDAEGNLYVAAGLHRRRGTSETLDTRPGIHVISPEGKLLAFVETPEDTITNCKFGGPDLRTLYVTCGKRLLSIRTRIPGKAAYRAGG